uniref:SWIM-type domain-containing protein n=1 Tax=Lactuca sativa TaxID=4236 RepID=A0A9R1VYA4_LACSA|nr:hypothetical protein LSAT_V11C400212300 [Lactuca sativa]
MVITSQLATNSAFWKRFHSIIWNSKMEPHEFEKAWKSCLYEFNISNNMWFHEMYGLCRRWVPAFFKDIPMSGVMRTTSLSEGQNWSLQIDTLTGFYGTQRRNQFVIDFNAAITFPRFITSSLIEPHASKVYTRKIFYQVQKEISDSDNTCFQVSVTSNNGVDTIIVLQNQKNISTMQPSSPAVDDKLEEYHYDCLIEDTQYTVTHSKIDGTYKCSCMHFEHVGLLCRHILCVFKFYSIKQISEEYIMRLWHRDRHFSNSLLDSNSDVNAIDIFSKVDRCVSFLSHDAAKLKSYLEELNTLEKNFVDDYPAPEMPSR